MDMHGNAKSALPSLQTCMTVQLFNLLGAFSTSAQRIKNARPAIQTFSLWFLFFFHHFELNLGQLWDSHYFLQNKQKIK